MKGSIGLFAIGPISFLSTKRSCYLNILEIICLNSLKTQYSSILLPNISKSKMPRKLKAPLQMLHKNLFDGNAFSELIWGYLQSLCIVQIHTFHCRNIHVFDYERLTQPPLEVLWNTCKGHHIWKNFEFQTYLIQGFFRKGIGMGRAVLWGLLQEDHNKKELKHDVSAFPKIAFHPCPREGWTHSFI